MTNEEMLRIIYEYMGRKYKYGFWEKILECISLVPIYPINARVLLALKDKMVEKGDWYKFWPFSYSQHKTSISDWDFDSWLFSLDLDGGEMPRFFRLFLESEVWAKCLQTKK